MMRFTIALFIIALLSVAAARTQTKPAHPPQAPKLVVLIVLDQFPYEYLTRFEPYFGENGFRYLLQNGANFTNATYAHAYTKTAPGHAAISTGCYAHRNGIISNQWYDRSSRKVPASVTDTAVHILGMSHEGRSPKNLLTYTIGDMLRIHTNFRSKVIGLAAKDRSAILLAGKLGTAYWFDDSLVVSSTYYMQSLPAVIRHFNESRTFQRYFGKQWMELRPDVAASICDRDDAPYESGGLGLGRTFPHPITGDSTSRITPSFYYALDHTPYSTETMLGLAEKIVAAESLGTRGTPDLLCLGISTTDEIGHSFGPNSHEVFDNAIRTDQLLGGFFQKLNKTVGLSNCLFVLTSDHGIPPIPEYLKARNPHAEAGRVSAQEMIRLAGKILGRAFHDTTANVKWVERILECDIYLNRALLKEKGIALSNAANLLADSLPFYPPIAAAYSGEAIQNGRIANEMGRMIERSYSPGRSGDVMFVLRPYYMNSGDSVGTNHGQPYQYDTHVPLILAGTGIVPGRYTNAASPIDIAPTLAILLGTEFPPSCEGNVLREALKK